VEDVIRLAGDPGGTLDVVWSSQALVFDPDVKSRVVSEPPPTLMGLPSMSIPAPVKYALLGILMEASLFAMGGFTDNVIDPDPLENVVNSVEDRVPEPVVFVMISIEHTSIVNIMKANHLFILSPLSVRFGCKYLPTIFNGIFRLRESFSK
jgi:hypothetical protein